jgi:cytochrome c oxidase subunit 2
MALVLVCLLAIVVGSSVYYFSQGWLPFLATASGKATDDQLALNVVLLGAVFITTHIALAAFIWRYREQRGPAVDSDQPRAMTEVGWALLAAFIFVGLNVVGSRLWAEHRFDGKARSENPVKVEVTGIQFQWYFRYPGNDGKFGRLHPRLVDASLGNPLGIDPEDPDGKDDRVSAMLTVPVGKEVELRLRAHDVIHSFFVPAFRLKQDAVPGSEMLIHFVPTRAGTYDIACAELCGIGHYRMNAKLKVMDEGNADR